MKNKIVALALALMLVGSSLIMKPVKALDANDYAYTTQSSRSDILKASEPIDIEPRG